MLSNEDDLNLFITANTIHKIKIIKLKNNILQSHLHPPFKAKRRLQTSISLTSRVKFTTCVIAFTKWP